MRPASGQPHPNTRIHPLACHARSLDCRQGGPARWAMARRDVPPPRSGSLQNSTSRHGSDQPAGSQGRRARLPRPGAGSPRDEVDVAMSRDAYSPIEAPQILENSRGVCTPSATAFTASARCGASYPMSRIAARSAGEGPRGGGVRARSTVRASAAAPITGHWKVPSWGRQVMLGRRPRGTCDARSAGPFLHQGNLTGRRPGRGWRHGVACGSRGGE